MKWYIFPYYLNESLPEDGIFNAYDNWETQYIVGRKYPEALDTFQIIEIGFIGPDKFVAFCLGPKSNIVYERYSMSSWGDSQYREVDYWEVENLMVNGETPFDKWLPYDVVCSTGSLLNSSHASYGCLNLNWNKETSGSRTDYPKESVSHIQAVGIRKLRVRFEE
ncbi:MAG: hypothetical protein QNK23_13695 [Crocinitomicaceae bacterium]|nr:hypothetical protein [Crocinitomicaceae bacterium]